MKELKIDKMKHLKITLNEINFKKKIKGKFKLLIKVKKIPGISQAILWDGKMLNICLPAVKNIMEESIVIKVESESNSKISYVCECSLKDLLKVPSKEVIIDLKDGRIDKLTTSVKGILNLQAIIVNSDQPPPHEVIGKIFTDKLKTTLKSLFNFNDNEITHLLSMFKHENLTQSRLFLNSLTNCKGGKSEPVLISSRKSLQDLTCDSFWINSKLEIIRGVLPTNEKGVDIGKASDINLLHGQILSFGDNKILVNWKNDKPSISLSRLMFLIHEKLDVTEDENCYDYDQYLNLIKVLLPFNQEQDFEESHLFTLIECMRHDKSVSWNQLQISLDQWKNKNIFRTFENRSTSTQKYFVLFLIKLEEYLSDLTKHMEFSRVCKWFELIKNHVNQHFLIYHIRRLVSQVVQPNLSSIYDESELLSFLGESVLPLLDQKKIEKDFNKLFGISFCTLVADVVVEHCFPLLEDLKFRSDMTKIVDTDYASNTFALFCELRNLLSFINEGPIEDYFLGR